MVSIKDVVFDCGHPASLARFWAATLDGYAVAPYDDEELARLKSLGFDGPEDDPGVIVEGPPGSPRYYFQLVPEGKVAKNRVHLDLWSDDLAADETRLVGLGARRLGRQPEPDDEGIVDLVAFADPEGNEFCITRRVP